MELLVDDMDACYESLLKAGARVTDAPSHCEKLNFHNLLAIDPNGVEIEVLVRP
ncbi:MAG: hypothetical protein Q4B26_08680 [Eubacteriales bacterium]|nr:hypothetical protein [Eubacteriales bacterium]